MRTMKQINDIRVMKKISREKRTEGKKIGFVPTMGALHAGHLCLIKRAKELADLVVVSIFINPTQFGPGEDLHKYPRDMKSDIAQCKSVGVDIIFTPSVDAMYPDGYTTYVTVEEMTENLCGRSRPGHFRGVATVVAKLFNIVQPHVAVFGQKDAQQVAVIRRMVKDLNVDINIVTNPIIREPDGLALSSRNIYLTPDERKEACVIFQSLQEAKRIWESGQNHPDDIIRGVVNVLSKSKLASIEYIEIVDKDSMMPLSDISHDALLALAVWFGKTRLIDNIILVGKGRIPGANRKTV
jgi:pantoate--beta-alanine ligase